MEFGGKTTFSGFDGIRSTTVSEVTTSCIFLQVSHSRLGQYGFRKVINAKPVMIDERQAAENSRRDVR